ncbi:hypothetical protein BC936DRAFT_138153 [Jimgerdemannia flammicorona]|uniref:Uncharacterized protein n=1 Tax=Jimgerdemannia flammicorona TaxID=994334 RepID=A0A433CVR2_9FUNG|nr:hypothetical protein BC936DRAFT_138153 [Jimgerdemannia flammicorona]
MGERGGSPPPFPLPGDAKLPIFYSDPHELRLNNLNDVERRGVEGLEHNLGHLFAVRFGVERGLGEEDGVFLGGDTQLIVEGVMPDLLHIVPVGDNAVLDGISQGENSPFGLGLVTDVRVLLAHTDHHTLVAGTTDNRGEHLAMGRGHVD